MRSSRRRGNRILRTTNPDKSLREQQQYLCLINHCRILVLICCLTISTLLLFKTRKRSSHAQRQYPQWQKSKSSQPSRRCMIIMGTLYQTAQTMILLSILSSLNHSLLAGVYNIIQPKANPAEAYMKLLGKERPPISKSKTRRTPPIDSPPCFW